MHCATCFHTAATQRSVPLSDLDDIASRLQHPDGNEVVSAVSNLVQKAKILRDASDRFIWKSKIIPALRRHPVTDLVYQDPFTDHARRKPRGYAGDALLLDYIYKYPIVQAPVAAASECGRNIFKYTGDGSAPRAVRNRRTMIADEIDRLAHYRPRAKVFSVASGHLREADLSAALQNRTVELTALDHDHLSVAHIREQYAGLSIRAEVASVKDVLRRKSAVERYDFIYAAGLYDYLDDRVASRLLECLLALCSPGGKVWVANFLPSTSDAGYMEAFMDWFLIYRSTQDMANLLQNVSRELISSTRVSLDGEQTIAFLEVVRS